MFKVLVLASLIVFSAKGITPEQRNKIAKEFGNDAIQNEIRREFYVFPAYLRGKFEKRKVGYLVFSNMEITKPRFLSLQDKRFREGLEIIKSPGIYRGKSAEKAFSRIFASKFYRKPSFRIRQGIIRPKTGEKINPLKEKLQEEKNAVVERIRGDASTRGTSGNERDSSVLEVDPNVELEVFDSGSEDRDTKRVKSKSSIGSASNSNKTFKIMMINTKAKDKSKIENIVITSTSELLKNDTKNSTALQSQRKDDAKNIAITANKDNFSLSSKSDDVQAFSSLASSHAIEKTEATETEHKSTITESSPTRNPVISKGILIGKRVDKNVPFASILNLGNYISFTGQNSTTSTSLQDRTAQPEHTDNISRATVSPQVNPALLVLNRGNDTNAQTKLRTYIIRFDNNEKEISENVKTNGTIGSNSPRSAILVSFSDIFDTGLAERLSKSLNVSLVEDTNAATGKLKQ